MSGEPDNLVLKLLREMRTKLDESFIKLEALEMRVRHAESRLDELRMTVTHVLGQSTETEFKQAKQGAQIDELFVQLTKLSAARNRSNEIPSHLLMGSAAKRNLVAAE
jgi:uncharacterized coiled-coil protein SlyX